MKEQMSDVPMPMRERFAEIVDLTDKLCDQHLNSEYKSICRKLAMAIWWTSWWCGRRSSG